MEYRKETKIKYGKVINRSGPRDLQKRTASNTVDKAIVNELRLQIKELTKELQKRKDNKNIITPEQLDAEITKEVTIALESVKKEYEIIINDLKNKVTSLKERIESKNELIEILKSKKDNSIDGAKIAEIVSNEIHKNSGSIKDLKLTGEERPQIENVFIDPLEKDAGDELESHINIKDISFDEKEKMANKVDKLKNLLGSLPK